MASIGRRPKAKNDLTIGNRSWRFCRQAKDVARVRMSSGSHNVVPTTPPTNIISRPRAHEVANHTVSLMSKNTAKSKPATFHRGRVRAQIPGANESVNERCENSSSSDASAWSHHGGAWQSYGFRCIANDNASDTTTHNGAKWKAIDTSTPNGRTPSNCSLNRWHRFFGRE